MRGHAFYAWHVEAYSLTGAAKCLEITSAEAQFCWFLLAKESVISLATKICVSRDFSMSFLSKDVRVVFVVVFALKFLIL